MVGTADVHCQFFHHIVIVATIMVAIRLPLTLPPSEVPIEEVARLRLKPELWWNHKLGGGGWLLSRERRELLDLTAWPKIVAVADLIPAKRLQFWVSMLVAKHSIREHVDSERRHAVRVHVPLLGEATFTVAGEDYRMKVGEFWAVNTVPNRHSAKNDGEVDRIHLLVDVFPNDWLRAHVPWL